MSRLASVAVAVALVCLLSSCGTHRRELESQVPPQGRSPTSTAQLARDTLAILERGAGQLATLSSDSLIPLTEAASLVSRRTGSIRAHSLVHEFADALLRARVTRAKVTGYYDAESAGLPRARATAEAGLALSEAYAATGERAYADATTAAAADIRNPALGWVSAAASSGVRLSPRGRVNVSATADAALLLKRAATLGEREAGASSQAALRTIYTSQAAVGRWYAEIGTHRPMTLGEWARTLFDLQADGSPTSVGITGGGMPALFEASFGTGGQGPGGYSITASAPSDVALAARALAAFGEGASSEAAFRGLLGLRRDDGTIRLAASEDLVSQSNFALAFAQRLAGPALLG